MKRLFWDAIAILAPGDRRAHRTSVPSEPRPPVPAR
jgi:hypothetical protein